MNRLDQHLSQFAVSDAIVRIRQCIVSKADAAARRSHSCSHLSPCLSHLLARVAVVVGCQLGRALGATIGGACPVGARRSPERDRQGRLRHERFSIRTDSKRGSLCKAWINPVCCRPTVVERLLPLGSETKFPSTFRIGNLFVEASASSSGPIVLVPRCHSSQCRHDPPTAPAGSTQEEVQPCGITLGNSGACVCWTAMWQSVPPRGLSKSAKWDLWAE